jgi:hypothetical protein
MIQTDSGDIDQVRARVHKMSGLEPRKFGRAGSAMASPKKSFGARNPAIQIQLDEARAEWRRRRPRPSPTA